MKTGQNKTVLSKYSQKINRVYIHKAKWRLCLFSPAVFLSQQSDPPNTFFYIVKLRSAVVVPSYSVPLLFSKSRSRYGSVWLWRKGTCSSSSSRVQGGKSWETERSCGKWNLLPRCLTPSHILFHRSPLSAASWIYLLLLLVATFPPSTLSGSACSRWGLKLKCPVHLKPCSGFCLLHCSPPFSPAIHLIRFYAPVFLLLLLLPPSLLSFPNFGQPQTFSPPLLSSLFPLQTVPPVFTTSTSSPLSLFLRHCEVGLKMFEYRGSECSTFLKYGVTFVK